MSKVTDSQDLFEKVGQHEDWLIQHITELTFNERFEETLKYESFFHELRHLHDYFGTWWGIQRFNEHLEVVRAFRLLLNELQNMDEIYLPLIKWGEQPSAPKALKDFLTTYRRYEKNQLIVDSPFVLPWEKGPAPEVDYIILDIEGLGCEIPAYVVTANKAEQIGEQISPFEVGHQIVPLGLETIIEGIARQFQNFRISVLFGDAIQEEVDHQFRRNTIPYPVNEHQISVPLLPYSITDYFLTKVLRKRGIKHYPRNLLLGISDYALSPWGADITSLDVTDRTIHPGWRFIEALEQIDVDSVPKTVIFMYTSSQKWSRLLVEQFEPVVKAGPPPSFLEQVEWFVLKDFIVPTLKLKTEHGDQVLTDLKEYMNHFHLFPTPRFFLTKDGFIPLPHCSAQYRSAWATWIIFNQLMLDMIKQAVSSCPRRRGNISEYLVGLDLIPPPSTCASEIKKGCGKIFLDYLEEDVDNLPQCLYRRTLEGFNINRLKVNILK